MAKYSEEFLKAVKDVLALEGGEVNDPLDNGGRTKYGISQRAYPQLNIGALTEEHAIKIYYEDYWQLLKCDYLPPIVAFKLFEMGVNVGRHRAVTLLQIALNAYNGNTALKIDGQIGKITITAVNLAVPNLLVQFLRVVQAGYYMGIVSANPSQERFKNGWLKRAGVMA